MMVLELIIELHLILYTKEITENAHMYTTWKHLQYPPGFMEIPSGFLVRGRGVGATDVCLKDDPILSIVELGGLSFKGSVSLSSSLLAPLPSFSGTTPAPMEPPRDQTCPPCEA